MSRLAVADSGRLDVSALEIERGGLSYTVDTLRALRAAHPDTQITLIVGADVAGTLTTWREPHELLALAELAVALRAGCEPETPQRIRRALDPLLCGSAPYFGLRFLRMPVIDISSSSVRERVRRGLAVEDLVGSAVATYIAAHGLYRGATAEAQAVS
jgi:nicotinate-nucleotide adenylyltransferase